MPSGLAAPSPNCPARAELIPVLRRVQVAQDDLYRQSALCEAYKNLNRLHNALGLAEAIQPASLPFHNRGFQVSAAWRYVEALTSRIDDDQLRAAADAVTHREYRSVQR